MASINDVVAGPSKMGQGLLPIPNNISFITREQKCNMGMWSHHIFSVKPGTIRTKLHGYDYGGGTDDKWDCEDRACWGVANLRCECLGTPVAIATGTAPKYGKQRHALILFWDKVGEGNYNPHFFDPDGVVNAIIEFNPVAIIPFPLNRRHSGGERVKLPPFDDEGQFPYVEKGAFVLDKEYDLSKVEDITEYLSNVKYPECNRSSGIKKQRIYKSYWTKSIEDRVLWAYIHARRNFIESQNASLPVGLGAAFGTSTDGGSAKDHAVLIIWGNNTSGSLDYMYWDIDKNNTVDKSTFTARLVFA